MVQNTQLQYSSSIKAKVISKQPSEQEVSPMSDTNELKVY